MHPSVVFIALSAVFAPGALSETPVWFSDYSLASKQGENTHKPLFVIIGSGRLGWEKLSRDGELGKDVKRLLAKSYVCLYVDTEHISGLRLAEGFEMAGGLGVVISDVQGEFQAFRHKGQLSNQKIAQYLERYSEPGRTVEYTETNDDQQVPVREVSQPVRNTYPSFARRRVGC